MRLFHQNVTFVVGPAAHEILFASNDQTVEQREVYSFTVPVFGKDIVYDAPHKIMTQQLKFVSKGLTGPNMEAHVPKIIKETEEYFKKWGNEGEINLMQALSELTILTASRCLLGDEIRENIHTEFAELYQELSDGMVHLSFFWPNAPIEAHRKRDQARKKIAAIFSKVINERRASKVTGKTDFLQVMLESTYKDGREVSTDEIVGLLLAALFAGQHTSNITGTWTGLLINQNKEKLAPRLLKEQEEVMAKHGGQINLEGLNEMSLLHNCMKETLRMYPPLIMLMRKVKKELKYKQYTVPVNDIIVACPPAAHRLPTVFKNPDEYDPDRFGPEREEDKKARFSFIAFGGGRHGCLGEKFGYLQTKTIYSILLRDFDIEPVLKDMPPPDYSAIVVGPKPEQCMIKFKRRKPLSA